MATRPLAGSSATGATVPSISWANTIPDCISLSPAGMEMAKATPSLGYNQPMKKHTCIVNVCAAQFFKHVSNSFKQSACKNCARISRPPLPPTFCFRELLVLVQMTGLPCLFSTGGSSGGSPSSGSKAECPETLATG